MAFLGKWSETKPADKDIQRVCDEMKPQVEEKTGENYGTFRAIEYRNYSQFQYVVGENYLIKVHVGSDEYLIIGVFYSIMPKERMGNLFRVEKCQKDSPINP